ncbi:MAG TPA: bifunctional DNA-formamidopyrimidine glycosylase/DNA-(apurinic or apyrimidinic site) lyase [Geomonas sp.]|nr:bifunctional DNA-formamidopyrimidine glycosylase/DNA-(apurinic or apyrimidinic site) lyase [Geomonas sp.]
MPELPEVEVTRLGISSHLVGNRVTAVAIHSPKLRHHVPPDLALLLEGQVVRAVERRGKYLILKFSTGSLLVHLGMTGHLRMVKVGTQAGPHDCLDIVFGSGGMLRLNDVRRFGSIHWTGSDPLQHKLLSAIGPEPLTEAFSGDYLYQKSRGRKVAVQPFIMDSSVVAGVGNIYAAESLFRCGLLPSTQAGALSSTDCLHLVKAVKEVLAASIATGRSTMDFSGDGGEKLAYFPQVLNVYGREGEPCRTCGSAIKRGRFGNRSTFFCQSCQH